PGPRPERQRRRADAALPHPAGGAGLLPVRVRGDHAAAAAGRRGRPDQLQGVAALRSAVVDLRLRRERVPPVGRRPVGRARRARLQRRGWGPPRGRGVGGGGGGGGGGAAAGGGGGRGGPHTRRGVGRRG